MVEGHGGALLTATLVGAIVIPWERRLRLSARRTGLEADLRDALQALGCLKYQGYLYERPVPLDVFEAALQEVPAEVLAA